MASTTNQDKYSYESDAKEKYMNKNERELWQGYHTAWEKAEYLQSLCDEPTLLFGVIYDLLQGRWLVNCVDTNQWLTERFHGGHRSYYPEVWRQQ